MRILQLHCDSIEYTPTKKEIKSAEDIENPETTRLEEVVVAFVAMAIRCTAIAGHSMNVHGDLRQQRLFGHTEVRGRVVGWNTAFVSEVDVDVWPRKVGSSPSRIHPSRC